MKYFLVLILITASLAYSQVPNEAPIHAKAIVDYSYNYEFDKADPLIEEGLKNYPDSPKYHFLYIGNEMLKTMKYRDDAKVEFKRAVSDSINNNLIAYGEKIIEKFEDEELNLEDKFFLGCIYGYIGRIHGVQGSWTSAFSFVKSGRNTLEEVLEEDSTYYDAYLVLGLLNYFADRMGGLVGFVAGILGLSGDRETGLDYLKIAQEKGTYSIPQATYMLIEIYTRLENNEFAALPYFEQFTKKYPKNAHLMNWYCRELMDVDLVDKAAEVINNDVYNVLDPYVKGRYYQRIGEYELSNQQLLQVESNQEMYYHWYYDHTIFMLAVNSLMLNDDAKAEEYKSRLNEQLSPIFEEMYTNKDVSKYAAKLGELIGKFDDNDKITQMLNNPPELDGNEMFLESLLEYYKGVNYFKSKNYAEAEKVFYKLKLREGNYFRVESVKYLLEIYSTTKVDTIRAEELIDFIDNMDIESLTYRAKDIEKKYDL